MSDDVGLVWLRRDLRLSDNPALAEATRRHERVLLCFCFAPGLTRGRHASPARNAFLLIALAELDREVRELGGRLAFREGDPAREIAVLAAEIGAGVVHMNEEHTAHGRSRDSRVAEALRAEGIELVGQTGVTCADVAAISKADGGPYKVFTPFYRAWREAPRRSIELRPRILRAPERGPGRGKVPSHSQLGIDTEAKRIAEGADPGEPASRWRLDAYMKLSLIHI